MYDSERALKATQSNGTRATTVPRQDREVFQAYGQAHLHPAGGKLQQLMSQWNEISSRMDVKTMLLDNALLELLHAKVRNPKLMELDLHVFDNLARNDPAGNYQALKDITNRDIKFLKKEREEVNRKEREKSLQVLERNAAPARESGMDEAKTQGKAAPSVHLMAKAKIAKRDGLRDSTSFTDTTKNSVFSHVFSRSCHSIQAGRTGRFASMVHGRFLAKMSARPQICKLLCSRRQLM